MPSEAYVHKVLPGLPGGSALLVFHGTGGDENQFLALGQDLLTEATIVAPRGDVSEHGAARYFRRTAEGVYDMADLSRATAKMSTFVKERAAALKTSAILGLGYSNGANILAAMIFAEPDLFDAAVLMHPLIPFEPKAAGSLSGRKILITAGRRDPICPPGLTQKLEDALKRSGAAVVTHWHDGGHQLRPSEIDAAGSFLRDSLRVNR